MSIFAIDEMAVFRQRSSQDSDSRAKEQIICELSKTRILLTFRRIEIRDVEIPIICHQKIMAFANFLEKQVETTVFKGDSSKVMEEQSTQITDK